VLHLLAFAVIVFATEAKLALYDRAPEPGIAAAKLSIEKNSSRVFSAIGKLEPTKGPPPFSVIALQFLTRCEGTSAATPVHSARISLIASIRLDHQGISRFHRPPPILL